MASICYNLRGFARICLPCACHGGMASTLIPEHGREDRGQKRMSSERVERIGLDKVRQLGENAIDCETNLPVFGARRRRSSDVVRFFVYYRTQDGRQRWHTLGRWGALTPETARKRAKEILGEVAK